MKFFSYSRSKNEQLAFDDRIHWLNKKKRKLRASTMFFWLRGHCFERINLLRGLWGVEDKLYRIIKILGLLIRKFKW